ncbi:Uncharacterized protein Rs2_38257 [Raphanus sativus]|nr:Uncharacterized protein Rs2_38257 [Raphanus sativus]
MITGQNPRSVVLLHQAMVARTITGQNPRSVVLLPQDSSSGKPPQPQQSYILVLDTNSLRSGLMLAPVAISIAAGFSGAIAAAASHSFETTEAYCSEEMGLGWLEAPLQLQLLSEAVDLYVPK